MRKGRWLVAHAYNNGCSPHGHILIHIAFSLDLNDEIQSGEKFPDIVKIRKKWERYVGTSFEPAGELESDVEYSEGDTEPYQRQKSRKAKEDPVQAVTHEDGLIWVEEISRKSRNTLQALVRGFLTAHYHECRHCSLWKCHSYIVHPGRTCGHKAAAVPFKWLLHLGHNMIAEQHLPDDFEFPDDPSHMWKTDVIAFLEFI